MEKVYNWNVKARLFEVLHKDRSSVDEGDLSFTWPDSDLPVNDEELPDSLVQEQKLQHGDILRFNDERFTEAFIVCRDEKGEHKLVENPDESGSGYLTIPVKVLENVTDAVAKYNNVTEQNCLNLHVTKKDKFVVDQLGDTPDNWEFDVQFVDGILDNVFVTQGEEVWECSDWSKADINTIKEFFEGAAEPHAKLVVKLDLKDDKLSEYKTKHGSQSKFAWVGAFPKLPNTWKAEKGASGMGSTHYKAEWKCKGPKTTIAEVKSQIQDFFEGFEVSVEEN